MNSLRTSREETSGLQGVLQRMTWVDRLLVLLVGLLVAVSFVLIPRGAQGQRVVVERDGAVVFTGELSRDKTVTLSGPLGDTVLQISAGSVRVLSSPCPAKVCIRTGEIHSHGELLACVPNHLVIRVEGDSAAEENYDLISR